MMTTTTTTISNVVSTQSKRSEKTRLISTNTDLWYPHRKYNEILEIDPNTDDFKLINDEKKCNRYYSSNHNQWKILHFRDKRKITIERIEMIKPVENHHKIYFFDSRDDEILKKSRTKCVSSLFPSDMWFDPETGRSISYPPRNFIVPPGYMIHHNKNGAFVVKTHKHHDENALDNNGFCFCCQPRN